MVTVTVGIQREIAALPDDLASSGLAAIALAMAERIDGRVGSPSECGKVAIQALEQLRALAPPKERPKNAIDELKERRAKRRSGLSGT